MATRDLPADFRVGGLEWGVQKAGVQFSGPYNGTLQAVDFIADRWLASITLNPRRRVNAGAVEAFFVWLTGGVNRVRLHHLARPVPAGTLRGNRTLAVAAARGDLTVTITASNGDTLLAGDLFKINGQLLQALVDCVAIGSTMVVTLSTRVRAAMPVGAVVTWDRPSVDFALPATATRVPYAPAVMSGLGVELEEVW